MYAKEIDAKIASGFYKIMKHSEWASTTQVVIKKVSCALQETMN